MGRRTQILLDDGRYERLRQRAQREGMSVAAVIRGAIDRELDDEGDARRRAAGAFLAAGPLDVQWSPESLRRMRRERVDDEIRQLGLQPAE